MLHFIQIRMQLNLLVRGILERWVTEHKCLFLLENVQWMDVESARLSLEIVSLCVLVFVFVSGTLVGC